MLHNLENFELSPALAECEKFGAENGWDENYLAGVRQINQHFEYLRSLRLRHQNLQRQISDLESLKLRAQSIAQDSKDSARFKKGRQITNILKGQLKNNRQQLKELQDEISSEMATYEELVNRTINNF